MISRLRMTLNDLNHPPLSLAWWISLNLCPVILGSQIQWYSDRLMIQVGNLESPWLPSSTTEAETRKVYFWRRKLTLQHEAGLRYSVMDRGSWCALNKDPFQFFVTVLCESFHSLDSVFKKKLHSPFHNPAHLNPKEASDYHFPYVAGLF